MGGTPPTSREHGSVPADQRARYSRPGRPLLDLSANVSPYGPAPEVRAALREVTLECYPDPQSRSARQAVAARFGTSMDSVAIGNGAAELIWAAARAFLGVGRTALQVQPTFGEFGLAVRACGAALHTFDLVSKDGFALDLAALSQALRAAAPRLCYLCTPNNPTGTACALAQLNALAEQHPSTLFLLDQAYLNFSSRHGDLLRGAVDNVICLRSLTKEQSLPGVRVGYILGAPALIAQIERQRPSWSVNSYAQAVVSPALWADEYVADVRVRMMADRERAQLALRQAGIATVNGDAPFLLAAVGRASACRRWLLTEQGIAVRDCTSFGLPGYARLSGIQQGAVERVRDAFSLWRALCSRSL